MKCDNFFFNSINNFQIIYTNTRDYDDYSIEEFKTSIIY